MHHRFYVAALVNTNKVNVFNPPPPPAYSPATLFSLPPGTPICRTGTANQNPTQPRKSELPASLPVLLKGVNQSEPVNLTGANPGVAPNITGPSPVGPTNKTISTPTQRNTFQQFNSKSTANSAATTAITPFPTPSAATLQVVDLGH
jgi:hypothetical protein